MSSMRDRELGEGVGHDLSTSKTNYGKLILFEEVCTLISV